VHSDPDHVRSTSLAIGADDLDARGRSPMCRQRTRPSLGGEAEGRSLGFISFLRPIERPTMNRARFAEGQDLFKEGDPADSVFRGGDR
jgi:hypothetical protein